MFSKACEYGIRACVYIAGKSLTKQRTYLNEISEEIDSPVAYTSKILQTLSKAGIIKSVRGQGGGFEMDSEQIDAGRISDIVTAIDGNAIFVNCGLGLKHCSHTQPCPVHDKFNVIRRELKHILDTTTIGELARGLKDGNMFLRRETNVSK